MNVPYSTGIAPYQKKAPRQTPIAVMNAIAEASGTVGKLVEGKIRKETIYNNAAKYLGKLPEGLRAKYAQNQPKAGDYSPEEYPKVINNYMIKAAKDVSAKYGDQAALDWSSAQPFVKDTSEYAEGAKGEKAVEGLREYVKEPLTPEQQQAQAETGIPQATEMRPPTSQEVEERTALMSPEGKKELGKEGIGYYQDRAKRQRKAQAAAQEQAVVQEDLQKIQNVVKTKPKDMPEEAFRIFVALEDVDLSNDAVKAALDNASKGYVSFEEKAEKALTDYQRANLAFKREKHEEAKEQAKKDRDAAENEYIKDYSQLTAPLETQIQSNKSKMKSMQKMFDEKKEYNEKTGQMEAQDDAGKVITKADIDKLEVANESLQTLINSKKNEMKEGLLKMHKGETLDFSDPSTSTYKTEKPSKPETGGGATPQKKKPPVDVVIRRINSATGEKKRNAIEYLLNVYPKEAARLGY